MTFPEYSPLSGRISGEVFPPVASVNNVPQDFDRSYEGSKELQRRIRRALTAFAARTWKFWQTGIYVLCLGAFATFAVGRADSSVYIPTLIFVVCFAAGGPITSLRDISKLAKTYANRHAVYAASFGVDSFIWQTATGTYEIRWNSIARSITRDQVTVLALEDSRAICVLPDELLSPEARSSLEALSQSKTV
jgi:hypothetical protein